MSDERQALVVVIKLADQEVSFGLAVPLHIALVFLQGIAAGFQPARGQILGSGFGFEFLLKAFLRAQKDSNTVVRARDQQSMPASLDSVATVSAQSISEDHEAGLREPIERFLHCLIQFLGKIVQPIV